MNVSNEILSDVTVFTKYAKYLPELNRRETFSEICDRYQNMMEERYPDLKEPIANAMVYVREKKILPSMRAMQFAGPAIEKNESRIYNCAYLPVDDYRAFSETMFLLLGGTGVGYSVQLHHVEKLPAIQHPTATQKYVIEDSIEGWADAVKYLMKSYLGLRKRKPRFDFSAIREKGARLVTAGGKAPGPEPLKRCLFLIEQILESKEEGSKLSTTECHDIQCHIADAVLSGGIRRAAMIALFSRDDMDMINAKSGQWWETNPQRGRANNSAVLERDKITEEEFMDLWHQIEASGSGEPGVYFTSDKDWGTNPCCEIALKPFQFCNLTEVNASNIESEEDFLQRALHASFLATLQAGFTDFHYLRHEWQETTEEDALIGVGITGIGAGTLTDIDFATATDQVKLINEMTAAKIGIKPAARTTTVKPSGSTSCVLGCSSGIHGWHDPFYIRRMQFNADESITKYLLESHPKLIKPYLATPGSYVLELPQKAPEGSIFRHEGALSFLDRVRRFNVEWVKQGHRTGANTNNVSATCNVRPNEWDAVGKWMWDNRDTFNGLSVLPYDNGTYVQAPFETITEEVYNEMMEHLHKVDLTQIIEDVDNTNLTHELACAGGACELPQ